MYKSAPVNGAACCNGQNGEHEWIEWTTVGRSELAILVLKKRIRSKYCQLPHGLPKGLAFCAGCASIVGAAPLMLLLCAVLAVAWPNTLWF